jgi:hypothetical protein
METLPTLMTEEAGSHWALIGAIPGRKIGRRWVFSRIALTEYLCCRGENLAPATRAAAET